MNNSVKTKTEYPKLAFFGLSLFLVLRAVLIFPENRTGFLTEDKFFSPNSARIVFLILVAVFGIVSSALMLKIYRESDSAVLFPLIFLAADPLLFLSWGSCIDIFLGILFILCIFNKLSEKAVIGDASAMFIFACISALLSPMSLFKFMPLIFAVYLYGRQDKDKTLFNALISALLFAAVSVIHGYLYKSLPPFKIFIDSFSFYTNREFFASADNYISSELKLAEISYVLPVIFSAFFFLRIRNILNEKASKNKKQKAENSEIFNAVFLLISFIWSAVGTFAFRQSLSVFALITAFVIIMIRSGDEFTLKHMKSFAEFLITHYFVFVFILLAFSFVLFRITNPGEIFSSAATYFM